MATISHSPSSPERRLYSRQDAEKILRIALERAENREDGLTLESILDIGTELGVPVELLSAVAREQHLEEKLQTSVTPTILGGSVRGVVSDLETEQVRKLSWLLRGVVENHDLPDSPRPSNGSESWLEQTLQSGTTISVDLKSDPTSLTFELKVNARYVRALVFTLSTFGGVVGVMSAGLLGWLPTDLGSWYFPMSLPVILFAVFQNPGTALLAALGSGFGAAASIRSLRRLVAKTLVRAEEHVRTRILRFLQNPS